MRSMNMLQLLGGVAVAGAVAAGTTAFTAGGLTTNLVNANARENGFVGGNNSVTIVGATLDKLVFTQTADAGATNSNNVTLATLTFAAGTPTDAVVTMTTGATLVPGSAPATGFHCSTISANVATCAVSDSSATAPSTGAYYSGLTSVAINVS